MSEHEFQGNRDGSASMLGAGTLRAGDTIRIVGWEGGDVVKRIASFTEAGALVLEDTVESREAGA